MATRNLTALVLACLVTGGVLLAADEPPQTPEQKLASAVWFLQQNKQTEALKAADEAIASGKLADKDKITAYGVKASVLRSQKKGPEAVKLIDGLVAAMPGNQAALGAKARLDSDILWDANKREDAVAKIRDFLKTNPPAPLPADFTLLLSARLGELGQNTAAYDEAVKAFALAANDNDRTLSALNLMQNSAYNANDFDKAYQAITKMLDATKYPPTNQYDMQGRYNRYVEILNRAKKFDELRAYYQKALEQAKEPRTKQENLIAIGNAWLAEAKYDEAVKAYDRVITDYPTTTDHWGTAQKAIVDALMKKGDFAEALKHARVRFDCAGDAASISESVGTIAWIIKGIDKDTVGRANQYINFQKFGPAGPDGKAGTADDLANPIEGSPYAQYPEREKVFAEARKSAGDDAMAARYRAMTYLYTGHPKEALAGFIDAFARCTAQQFAQCGNEMVVYGVKAVRGHATGLEPFYQYVNFGPAGPDGKVGTADDLKDPFTALGVSLTSAAPAAGGAAGLAEADVKQLQQLRDQMEKALAEDAYPADLRKLMVAGLTRVHEALADWGGPQQRKFYLELATKNVSPEFNLAVAAGAQASYRGSTYHLGGVYELWADLDAAKAQNKPIPAETLAAKDTFTKNAFAVASTKVAVGAAPYPALAGQPLAPQHAPLALQPSPPDFAKSLQPLPEPKK